MLRSLGAGVVTQPRKSKSRCWSVEPLPHRLGTGLTILSVNSFHNIAFGESASEEEYRRYAGADAQRYVDSILVTRGMDKVGLLPCWGWNGRGKLRV